MRTRPATLLSGLACTVVLCYTRPTFGRDAGGAIGTEERCSLIGETDQVMEEGDCR